MKNSEVIFFIGKCLTMSLYPQRIKEIANEVRSAGFNWENVVYNASNQFVLPTWFLQMKNAGLTDRMPTRLKVHVKKITDLNRLRNREITHQAQQIAGLLQKNNIEPVFLKGTAHLLMGLYNDPAERMIGDIDFLVKTEEIESTAALLMDLNFKPLVKYDPRLLKIMKHYPRMSNDDYPAAVEIHRQIVHPPNDKKYPAEPMIKEKRKVSDYPAIYVPSNHHLLVHNMLNAQINDKSFVNAQILLRQMYDFLLLAEKEKPLNAFAQLNEFRFEAETWLATSSLILGYPENLKSEKNFKTQSYLKWYEFMQNNLALASFFRTLIYLNWRFWRNVSFMVKAIYNIETRGEVSARLTDKSWYANHFKSYINYFKSQ